MGLSMHAAVYVHGWELELFLSLSPTPGFISFSVPRSKRLSKWEGELAKSTFTFWRGGGKSFCFFFSLLASLLVAKFDV